MKDSEIIDDVFTPKNKTILFPKSSIAIIGVIISPIFSLLIYCANLRYTNQKDKIFGTICLVFMSEFIIGASTFGFKQLFFPYGFFNPLLLIKNIIVTLLMLYPLWKKHFENISYEVTFPYFRVMFTIVIYMCIFTYHYMFSIKHYWFEEAPWYMIPISTLVFMPYFFLLIILWSLIKPIIGLIKKLSAKNE